MDRSDMEKFNREPTRQIDFNLFLFYFNTASKENLKKTRDKSHFHSKLSSFFKTSLKVKVQQIFVIQQDLLTFLTQRRISAFKNHQTNIIRGNCLRHL